MPSIGKFIKHQSQFNDKFQVSLQVHTAFGVQEAPPTTLFFVSYRRGDHKGASMKLHSSSPHTIAFDQTCNFNFPCTLYYYDIAKKDYEEKELTVMFNEETSAEPPEFKTLGKANIDLAKYAKEVPINSSKSFPLTEVLGKKRKGEALRLQVTLTLTCLLIQETPKEEATSESACSITPPASAPLPIPTSNSNNSINIINNNNNNNNHHDHSTPSYPSTPPSSGNLQATPMSSTRAFLTSTSPIRNNSAPDRSGSASSIGGLSSSFSAPSRTKTDDDSISSYSSRNNSPPSSPSSSPSTSPRATTPISSLSNSLSTSLEGDTLDRLSNSGITRRSRSGSGNTEKEKVPFPCLPSSNSYSNLSVNGGKPFLSTPVKMHLLEKQSSDSNLLNTGDIAKRLASRLPELGKSREGTPGTPKMDRIDIRSSMDSFSSPPARPFPAVRRHLDFKTEKVRSYTDIKVPLRALKQKDDEKFLTEEIINMQPTYCNKIPVLAYIMFRSLLQWRSFHPNNSLFLDSVFQAFNNQSNIDKTDVPVIEVILYRISSAVTLLHILHKELQILSDNVSSVLNDFEKRLKQSLNTYYELYYSKVKEELDGPILSILGKVKTEGNKVDGITDIFEKHLNLVRTTIFFDELQHQIIYQIFYYFSARVLNSLLQRTTSCQCQVGLGLKMAVLHIENWAALQNPARETAENNNNTGTGVVQLQCDAVCGWIHSVCRRAMSAARQAADVLVVTKSTLVEPKIREEVCPSLSAQQLLVLLEGYVPDEFDPEPIHPGVLKSISELPVETKPNNYATQNNILSSPLVPYIYPFPLDTHFQQFLPLDNISIPSFITDQPGFSFLRDVCSSSNQHW